MRTSGEHAARLAALRAQIREAGGDGCLVPLTDEHQSEYVGEYAHRLRWLTGFTGSAGMAVVLADRAALFSDGRYRIQASAETDPALWEVCETPLTTPASWLAANAPRPAKILYDPWLHATQDIARLQAAAPKGVSFAPAPGDLVDRVWRDRPPPSSAAAEPLDLAFTGRSVADKLAEIAAVCSAHAAAAVVITALDSVAWALNVRGRDVPYTPVVRAFLIVQADGRAMVFIDAAKLDSAARAHLGDVEVRAYGDFAAALRMFAGARVLIDPACETAAIREALAGAEIAYAPDPCVWPRALKTPVELSGARAAHRRDGVAVCRFLHWVEREGLAAGADEIEAADVLEGFRRELPLYREPSFATISAVGANAALPHYVPKRQSAARLTPGTVFLVDSGGQYLDGTTDVTRTVALGTPTPEMRRHFTLALQGHLAIAAIKVPLGTTGGLLDPLARQHLWSAGLDYATGTGHGVGACLSVHEGPVFIGKRGGTRPVEEPLAADTLLTIEPGLYLEGRHGARTENVYLVHADAPGWLAFESLTLAPIDRALIETTILSPRERAWIDAYHARVAAEIGPLVEGEVRTWLERACSPLD